MPMNRLPIKHRVLLFQSLVFSLFFHGLVAFWLDGNLVNPEVQINPQAPLLTSSLQLLKEREIKNSALKKAFEKTGANQAEKKDPKALEEQFTPNFAVSLNPVSNEPVLSLQVSLPFPVNRFSLPPPAPFLSSFNLSKEIVLPEKKAPSQISSSPIDMAINFMDEAIAKTEPIMQTIEAPEIHFDETLPKIFAFSKKPFSLPNLPPLSKLDILTRSDWFDTELLFLPIDDEEGAQFAVTLVPNPQLEAQRLSQDFIFLIDRANSIQKERLFATKQALNRILKEINPEDRFNIVAFDSKIDKLFVLPMEPSSENLEKASAFLNSIELGSFFSPSDLYRPLLFALPQQLNTNRLTNIVLLSDGEALQKKPIQMALLQDWSQRNKNLASLYAITLESDAHIQSLDALCTLNRGKLLTAPTHRGIRKKLLRLLKTVDHPIANEVTVTAINKRTGASIPLSKHFNPCLYLGQPTVILGSIEKLDDFVLFVQAKVDGKWVHVKKTLSFLYAKRGGRTLRTEIALQKAYEEYLQYSEDKDSKHLTDARAILEPYDLLPAFQ